MIRKFAFTLTVATLPFTAIAQPSTRQAADDAEAVVARAAGAFEQIDPDSQIPTRDDGVTVYAGLPPLMIEQPPALTAASEMEAASAEILSESPRAPAVRMISNEVVQPLPAAPLAIATTAVSSSDPFVIKSILPIEGAIRYGDWFWDESAAPATGKLVITVDLDARVISAFRNGHEIGTAVTLLGTQEHPTPLGSFPILTKEKDNVSEKYNNAPMPWTLRLTWNGIAIHGSPVMNGYASHGCIGVPDEFAAKLFAAAKRGDKVIITRGKMVGVGDKML